MLLKLCFSTFPHQSSLRCFYAQKQLRVLSELQLISTCFGTMSVQIIG